MNADYKNCYCAFCRAPRNLNFSKHVSFIHILMSGVMALVMSFFVWQEVNPKSLLFMGAFLLACEFYLQIKFRVSVICPHCSFDPVLYLKSPEKAEAKVSRKLKKHQNSAIFLFSKKNPYLRLKKIRREKAEEALTDPLSNPVSVPVVEVSPSQPPV